jgi:hypothetical protein
MTEQEMDDYMDRQYRRELDETIRKGIEYALHKKDQKYLDWLLKKLKADDTVNIYEVESFDVKETQIWSCRKRIRIKV